MAKEAVAEQKLMAAEATGEAKLKAPQAYMDILGLMRDGVAHDKMLECPLNPLVLFLH